MRNLIWLILILNFVFVLSADDIIYFTLDALHKYQTVMLVIDPESGDILDRSAGALEFYGYDELIGKNIMEINVLSSEEVRAEMEKASKEQRNFFHFKHLLANGEVRYVHVNSYPMMFRDKTVLLSRIRDVHQEIHKQNTRQLLYYIAAAILLVFVFVLCILVLISRKARLAAREESKLKSELLEIQIETEKILTKQLQEKEILMREVHHRIKNNIASIQSLISLQAKAIDNPEAKTALQDTLSRVKSMKTLYDKLLISEDYSEISAKAYTEKLLQSVLEIFPESGFVKVEKEIDEFTLDTKRLYSLGIIINELLTNIMKYAFSERSDGKITISLKRLNDHVYLDLQDNGRGLPPDFDLEKTKGFGLMLVSMMTEQLQGEFEIKNENGTLSRFKFQL